ncbi:MAG: CAP domain-containing protein, partial [Pseudolysinimonas sp.]
AAVVVLTNETDKPEFPRSAPAAAVKDRAVDLDSSVTAALAAVPAVGVSVQTAGLARLTGASSASAESAAAAAAALAALKLFLDHHYDARGLIIPAITTVKAAQASSDAAVAAARAAAQAAAQAAAAQAARRSGGGSFSAGPGAPVCASDVLSCVNQIRSYYGLRTLSSNGTLNAASQACAERMAASGQMTHSTYPGGWRSWGENIAQGYGSSASVFNAWMASPGHRANILNSSYTQMGLGHVAAGSWWCEQFGS